MKLEINKEELCINRVIGEKNEVFEVDSDVIVPDIKPDILNIINQNGIICIYKKDVMDGKIKIEGCINIYVMYYPDSQNEAIRALHTSIDFSRIIEVNNIQSNMSIEVKPYIKDIQCKILNGRKLNVNCEVGIDLKVMSNENISIIRKLEGDNNIQTLVSDVDINTLVGMGEAKVIGKENIKIDKGDKIKEILNVSINIGNRDIKTSYNKIITKAEAEVKILYLTEDNRINTVESKIPLMGFIDIQNVSDSNFCETNYIIKNVNININQEEEHSIMTEIETMVVCRVYGKESAQLLQDLYSRRDKLTFTNKQVEAMSCKRKIEDVCSIREKISIPELADAEIYDAIVEPTIKSRDVMSEKVIYQGNINIRFLYSKNKGERFETQEYNMPFDFTINNKEIDKSLNIEEIIEMPLHDFVIMQEGEIETKIDLIFNLEMSKNTTINILENINVEEEKEGNNYSMTIYFVKPNDTLWEIAKQFKSTVEDIVKVNDIENENNIQVGQQLFLPR